MRTALGGKVLGNSPAWAAADCNVLARPGSAAMSSIGSRPRFLPGMGLCTGCTAYFVVLFWTIAILIEVV